MKYRHLEIECIDTKQYTIKNLASRRYVKMGARETKYLLQCIECPKDEFNFEDIEQLNQEEQKIMDEKFQEWGFLDENQVIEEKKDITKIKICEINPSEFLSKVPRFIQNLFSFRGALLILALTVAAFYLIFKNPELVLNTAVECLHMAWYDYVIFYVLMVLTTMLHEFGHAICCNRNGGKVSSMGLMLFFLMPCFFCDVSDIYMFKNKKKSFGVAVSGIATNYAMGLIGCLVFFALAANNIYAPILLFYFFANIGFVVFNLIPFVKLDGYWVATALIDVDNLMDKSILMFFTGLIKPRELKAIACTKMKKAMLFIYGFSAIIFRPIFWVISVYSAYEFLDSKNLVYLSGVVVGFVLVVIYKDISDLLKRYVEMYKNQKQRVFGMI
ncbi:MAG: M50 family metallopeptidase [Lachnospiraceae bacterium]|nr:M50 family metallopeptidase [Lachnospiraceae bacterium]